MRLFAPLAFATLLAATASAQTAATFTDPANLRGERVRPRDGRELPIDGGEGNAALGLEQLLRKLQTRASILNIVAHPDDEDGGMLTLYARGLGARVADLSLTRGEGGQNAMTADFEDALGLLRTQELLANDRYTGVDQFFGTEVDFGFSKTKSEAFAKWTHERVLYDAVRVIRLYRPLVITSSWVGAATDGHGQHQAAGQIAQEAFVAAGDPKVFPEMEREGILPWQPLRMYARVPAQSISDKGLYDYATGQYVPAEFTNYVTGQKSTTPPSTDVIVHEGQTDPLLTATAAHADDLPKTLAGTTVPLSYVQFARIGLGLQRSQVGPGVRNASAGRYDVGYHLYGDRQSLNSRSSRHEQSRPGQPAEALTGPDFFDGIDTSILGLQDVAKVFSPELLPRIAGQLQSAQKNFNPVHPDGIAPLLAETLHNLDLLIKSTTDWKGDSIQRANILHELRWKRVQLNNALALSLGLTFDASADTTDSLIAGHAVTVNTKASKHAAATLEITRQWLEDASGTRSRLSIGRESNVSLVLESNADTQLKLELDAPRTSILTRPYFQRTSIEQTFYDLTNPSLRSAPTAPPAITAWSSIAYEDASILIGRVVHQEKQPVHFIPATSVSLHAHAQILSSNNRTFLLSEVITPRLPGASSTIEVPPGWNVHPHPQANRPEDPDGDTLLITVDHPLKKPVTLPVSSSIPHGPSYKEGFRPIGYGDLPRTNFYTPANVRIVPADFALPTHLRLAYIPGTGDDVPSALASIGLKPDLLTIADLTPSNLAHYDTIILGVRTYNAHPDLHGAPTQALFDFARNGGNVVVQYQTQEFTAADAPYPLSLGSNEKVVDETAPVRLLDPGVAEGKTSMTGMNFTLLSTPNQITPADFDGWVNERGHGFLSTWDDHYTALTETHDPGAPAEHVQPQSPQRGGLITTPLGKGRWTYCAFALYRQLPEANPGAFRLFLNLINAPSAK